MKHHIHPDLVSRQIKIAVVGAGGTGSRIIENLINLHRAMVALGHPGGIHVTLIDDDVVSAANVGRQAFYQCDIGTYKSLTLINRANMSLGDCQWKAVIDRIKPDSSGICNYDMVIGAVDNRSARFAILRALENAGGCRYYLDLGNRSADGQVLLGEVIGRHRKTDDVNRLPHIGEMFPELIDKTKDSEQDDIPSCSLAEALQKQSLFINPAVSLFAATLLWNLFTKGEIEHHGAFVNLDQMTVMPIAVDPDVWKRFGVSISKKRNKK